jgi:hypothetical protein
MEDTSGLVNAPNRPPEAGVLLDVDVVVVVLVVRTQNYIPTGSTFMLTLSKSHVFVLAVCSTWARCLLGLVVRTIMSRQSLNKSIWEQKTLPASFKNIMGFGYY